MDPIGIASDKRKASAAFDALGADVEREAQLAEIVARARKLKPRRRISKTAADLSDIGPNLPPMPKAPTASPATAPSLSTSSAPPPQMPGPSPLATAAKQPTMSPAMAPPAGGPPMSPSIPQASLQQMPIPGPSQMPTESPATAPPPSPPMPDAPTASPEMPRAEPMTSMPGEPTEGSMPQEGTPSPTPMEAPIMESGPGGTTEAPNPYPNSPSAKMFYDLAGGIGGDAGRNFVNGLPQWAQQYGLPIGGGLAGLLGMYLLSRFMGNGQNKTAEMPRILEDMHGMEAWNSAPGGAPPAGVKMSKTHKSSQAC